jgi:hypothetical protein
LAEVHDVDDDVGEDEYIEEDIELEDMSSLTSDRVSS